MASTATHQDQPADTYKGNLNKRPRTDTNAVNARRRKVACQTCRRRKVKCSLERPVCSLCRNSGSECEYLLDPPNQTLERVAENLNDRFDAVSKQLEDLRSAIHASVTPRQYEDRSASNPPLISPSVTLATPAVNFQPVQEPSRDFSHIPPHRTTADTVLTWPVFGGKFPSNHLIQPLLSDKDVADPQLHSGIQPERDNYVLLNSLTPLEEERIPALVDSFLQNVHTKNPILDVEMLVLRSREAATQGLKWDAWSCILLLASALGSIAKPFGAWESRPDNGLWAHGPATEEELRRGEHCFILACRRLGLLKQTMLASQCHFFAGVYLMYTLRPMLSWQHFHQASITYQMYLKTTGRLTEDYSITDTSCIQPGDDSSRKLSRLEQRLYWSCFKSEAEFRVELPLPQSELAEYEFPKMFPSPPSPPSPSQATSDIASNRFAVHMLLSPSASSPQSVGGVHVDESSSIRVHAKKLCREEESWYYYLTEVALRRIGNRIINTFFTSDHQAGWLNIEPYLDIAMEFEAQVSTWYANLPPAMQRYETSSAIRAPVREGLDGSKVDFVSRELSWATENRLSEMRSWLYQPFLYYLIHARPRRPSNSQAMAAPAEGLPAASLLQESSHVLWSLILRGVDCNLTILETRSHAHRHHGLWYDLRAIMCASVILLAIVRAGYIDLIPGGTANLIGTPEEGSQPSQLHRNLSSSSVLEPTLYPIRGKLGKVLAQLHLWSIESPDMKRHAQILESLIREVMV